MSGIEEMREKAEIFSLSIGLNQASFSLEKIAEGKRLTSNEIRNLRWAAALMGEVDWDGSYYRKTGFSATQASRLRPDYYGKLIDLKFSPSKDYITRLYETFNSGGQKITLSKSEMENTKRLFKEMSDALFNRLNARYNI